MLGKHQVKNAVAAVCALLILKDNYGLKITEKALKAGLAKAKQNGRFEVMSKVGESPVYIIDGAHNPDGALALKKTMRGFFEGKKILMVTGMLADKDTSTILSEFTQIAHDFIVTEPINPRKMDMAELAGKIEALGGNVVGATEFKEAFDIAMEKGAGYDVVLFAGSLYLIGEIRTLFRLRNASESENN